MIIWEGFHFRPDIWRRSTHPHIRVWSWRHAFWEACVFFWLLNSSRFFRTSYLSVASLFNEQSSSSAHISCHHVMNIWDQILQIYYWHRFPTLFLFLKCFRPWPFELFRKVEVFQSMWNTFSCSLFLPHTRRHCNSWFVVNTTITLTTDRYLQINQSTTKQYSWQYSENWRNVIILRPLLHQIHAGSSVTATEMKVNTTHLKGSRLEIDKRKSIAW